MLGSADTTLPGTAARAAPRASPLHRSLTVVVFACLIVAAVQYAVMPFLAVRFWQTPFVGGFVEKTMAFNGLGSEYDPPFPAYAAGVAPRARLLRIDGAPVRSGLDINMLLSQRAVGQTVVLTVQAPDGQVSDAAMPLEPFAAADLVTFFLIPYLIGLAYLAIGVWVFWLRRQEIVGRAFALFCAAVAVSVGGIFDLYSFNLFTWAWTLAIPVAGASMMTLALIFPQAMAFVERYPATRLLPYAPALAMAGYGLYTLYAPGVDPEDYVAAWLYHYLYMGLGICLFLGTMLLRWRRGATYHIRGQSRTILIGSALAFSMILYWVGTLIPALGRGETTPFNAAVYLPPLIFFPIFVAYAILRYRLLDTDVLLARGLVYGLMSVLTLAGYGLILTGFSLLIGSAVQPDNPVVIGLTIFIFVAAFNPLRTWLQRTVDDTFFRGARSYAQRLEQFGRSLTSIAGLSEVARAISDQIEGALRPAHLHLFLRDALSDEYGAYAEPNNRHHTDIRFASDGPVAATLAEDRASLLFAPDQPPPNKLLRDRARLALLGSALYVPLLGKGGLTGWLAVGPKLSAEPFSRNDVRFVEALADQSALAVERAMVIGDLERRVKELNVISQMSQAVSFTIAYDDLLELIYAQASKIVDTRNFRILLKQPRLATVRSVFVVKNDDRVAADEGRLVPAGVGLESVVLRTGQPLQVDDYVAECRRRNVTPGDQLFRAWMGVPLNAGAEAIGVMLVGSLDAEVRFTDDQLKVFSTIADQAASAVVRARLFEQTAERARQLASLNEISTSLASNLELDSLLQRITQNSSDILACEAGSLFLVDEETDEVVFRVAVGPVGQELVGMRIARGKGFVGEAIDSGTALVVNDVQSDPRWFKGADQASGFVTRALMVVPLRFQGKPIGAVEVINKRDGSPFDENDQNLLTAFAGPAAVAIENARLFTQTDQALAARVEELSIMQRIDRELNTALDLERVMGITLDWAMKRTGAYAGSVGIVGSDGLRIVATQGYGDSVDQLRTRPRSLDGGIMGNVVRSGQISLVRDVREAPDYRGVLADTRSQLTIPVKREREVMGLINLESPAVDAFDEAQVDFVTRLVDHASIAITNARLYAEVNAANAAKSDLMSFVAHELKTPMTPIKGYASILLAGAVGPITDTQKQFLSVIHKNIERMTTIVTDMNDSARIEAGKLRLEPMAISLQTVIDDVIITTQNVIAEKKQTLRQEIGADLPPIWADSTRTAQILTNLLSNAYKYTPEGGEIVLRVRRTANEWDPDGAPEVMHISIQDNGIGIAPEDQKKLFQKFFRSDDRQAREMAPGTGLGLNIVKNLVELQGGQIWLESEFRKGSTFHFTVPVALEGQMPPAER